MGSHSASLPFKHRDHIAGNDLHVDTYTYGAGHTDTGVQITIDHGQVVLNVRLPREQTRTLAAAMLAAVEDDPGHIIEFYDEGWTIQHPLSCRPNLYACPVNRAAERDLVDPPGVVGRFECDVNDIGDRLLIGDRVDDQVGHG